MAKWCRVDDDNFVVEVIDFDPAGRFHPDMVWFSCPDETEQQWIMIVTETETEAGTEITREFRPATSADRYTLEEYKDVAYEQITYEAELKQIAAESTPTIGITLDERGREKENKRRDNRAKKKDNKITDADDHLLDHIDEIYDAADRLEDAVEAASDHATIDAILADLPNSPEWPEWVPE